MEATIAIFAIGMLLAFAAYFVGIALSIVLLVKVIHAGIACIKLPKFPPRDKVRFVDTRKTKALWIWILVLSIFFAIAFPISIAVMDTVPAIVIAFITNPFYLNGQLAMLVAGNIILKKYSKALSAYEEQDCFEKV